MTNVEFKSLLSRAGLNQTEAAKYLKITRRQVVNYCNGTTKPRHWVVEKLEELARSRNEKRNSIFIIRSDDVLDHILYD